MSYSSSEISLIYSSVALAIAWALYNTIAIQSISVSSARRSDDDEEAEGLAENKTEAIISIGEKIARGANSFLFQEYYIMAVFIVIFAIVALGFVLTLSSYMLDRKKPA